MAELESKAKGAGSTSTRTITLPGPNSRVRTIAIHETVTSNSASGRFTTTITSTLRPTSDTQTNGQSSSSYPPLTSSSSSSSSSTGVIGGNPTSSSPTTSSITSTTAAAASASATASSLHRNGHGFTAGDIAGAAVGCLIGGALIAFLIAFLLFRRKKSRSNDTDPYFPPTTQTHQVAPIAGTAAAGGTEKSISPSDASTLAGWMAYLPQSADDRTIQNAVKTFFNAVELHVDNFYHRSLAPLDPSTKEALAQLDSGKLPERLEDMMLDTRLAIPAIKHSIADLLITRLSPLTFPETSLLPAHLAAYPPKLQSSSSASGENSAVQQAYSQWRLLNAYLYPSPEKDTTYIEDRELKASEISDVLSTVFHPWQNASSSPPSEDEKSPLHEHERSLVATAGNLGILLISQPAAFEFRWSDRGAGARSASGRPLIAFPGFWKVADEAGRPLEQAQILVEPVVLRV